jgi:hypothetical protein
MASWSAMLAGIAMASPGPPALALRPKGTDGRLISTEIKNLVRQLKWSEAGGEGPDLVGEPDRLVEGHENRAVVEFDEAALREEVSEERSMAARYGAVVDGPD